MQTESCPSEIENKLIGLGYSQQSILDLEVYVGELKTWASSINLIGPSTLPHIWHRHILDCAQIARCIPQNITSIMDLGTGAGLPGLVLASLRQYDLYLVEPNIKRVTFLRHIAARLNYDLRIHPYPVESLENFSVDLIVSRAVANPVGLLRMSRSVRNSQTCLLCFFGQKTRILPSIDYEGETFHVKHFESWTDTSSQIGYLTPDLISSDM